MGVAKDNTVEVESLALTQTFVREEEEQLFLNDRPTKVAAKLVALKGCRVLGG